MSKEWYLRWHKKLETSKRLAAFWRFFGIHIVYVYLVAAVGMLFFPTTRFTGLGIIAAFIFGKIILDKLLALSFQKSRPYQRFEFTPVASGIFSKIDDDPDSFPSGHTTSLVAITIVLASLSPVWVVVSAVCTVMVMVGRVVLGYHFISDIVWGLLVGAVTGLFVLAIMYGFALY